MDTHGRGVEAGADLRRHGDCEPLALGARDAATLELFLERLALGFGAFQDGIGVTDEIREVRVG